MIITHNLCILGPIDAFDFDIGRQHVGCFKDAPTDRDLQRSIIDPDRIPFTVAKCVEKCAELFYMYAGVQNGGDLCFCGKSYGKHGLGKCRTSCKSNFAENCGGETANAVFKTNVLRPGPPMGLKLTRKSETSRCCAA